MYTFLIFFVIIRKNILKELASVDIIQGIKDFFFGILFLILKGLCFIVDMCQILVKKLAGIDTEGMLYGNQIVNGSENSSTVTGDIVEVLIRSDVVRNLFISLLVLGIILLLIVTFVAVWKTEWEFGKDGNSKTKIFNSAFKALFNFIAVPVVAFFGIFVGNALLRAIDGATKGDSNRSITNFVLSSAFANASRYEYKYEGNNSAWVNANLVVKYKEDDSGNKIEENGQYVIEYQGILNYFKSGSQGEVQVDQILEAFQNNKKISKQTALSQKYRVLNADGSDAGYTYALEQGKFTFSFDDSTLTAMFFDNSKINYIMIYIILIFMIKAMLTITFGLVKRLYYVVILFIISPPIVAMSPLNDKLLGKWREMFIANVCSAFVTIGIYNIFLSIYPAFEKIKFPNVGTVINFFASLLMIAVGLLTIDGLSGEIAKMLGVKELYAESTDKEKNLWGGAFGMAGKGFLPFSLGAKAIGKGVQYGMTAKYQGLGAAAKQFGKDVAGGTSSLLSKTPVDNMIQGAGIYGRDKGKIVGGLAGQAQTNHKLLMSDKAKMMRAENRALKSTHKEVGDEMMKLQAENEKSWATIDSRQTKVDSMKNYIDKQEGILGTYEKYKDLYADKSLESDARDYNFNKRMAEKYKDIDQDKYTKYMKQNAQYLENAERMKQINEYNAHKSEWNSAKMAVRELDKDKLEQTKKEFEKSKQELDKIKKTREQAKEAAEIFNKTAKSASKKEKKDAVAKYTAKKDAENKNKK